jgi:4-hydroxy-tetrahydrodipicolinate synthase
MKALTGIWTPTLVPLDTRGRINEQELRRFIDWLIASGIHGLFANGSTGEFTRFTSEERRRIAEITCDQARGRVPVLVGSAEVSINETLSASEAYLSMGARAVAVVAPFYFPLTPLSVLQYFR